MKRILKRVRITIVNLSMLSVLVASGVLLLHDCFIWGIKPLFTGEFILLTYFGFFADMFAILCFITAKEYFKKLFN